MNENKGSRTTWLYFVIISTVLLALDVLRMIHVPITHDEAITIVDYTILNGGDIMAMKTAPSANNHILNTLLAKLSINLFGYSHFVVRLPNLLGYICFLVFSAKICRLLFKGNKTIEISVFLLLNLNPFMFEFWGLCRGYGLSIGLMMASIFYLISYSNERRIWQLYLSLFLCIASVYTSLALLNFYVGLVGAIVIIQIVQRVKVRPSLSTLLALAISTICLAALIYEPIRRLRETAQLYYGGMEGFIPDTINSVVKSGLHNEKGNEYTLAISYVIAIILGCMAAHSLWLLFKKKNTSHQLILNIVLVIAVASVIAQHHLLGTLYLIDRTALFFVPLFTLAFAHYVHKKNNHVFKFSIVSLGILSLINFSMNINVERTFSWPFNIYEKEAMDRIVRNNKERKKVLLYTKVVHAPSFQYYAFTKYNNRFEDIVRDYSESLMNPNYDYYFVTEKSKIPQGYTVDTIYGGTYYLMKKNK